jgi:23S rRNA (adenine2030-N6)-methyltransferase
MLSYRHAFHAGNHADVLKHLTLIQAISYLAQKPAPLLFVDTHAGAGRYSLAAEEARKLGEYREGIGRLWDLPREKLPDAVRHYRDAIRILNPDGILRAYPGSPWFMQRHLRPQDRLRLFELHGNECKILAANLRDRGRQTQIVAGDGLRLLKSLLPPPDRRALVLIDPSYETRADYAAVPEILEDAVKRFATGTYILWHPLIARLESLQLPGRLKRLAPRWLHATLTVKAPPADGIGLFGSGLFILNPPWTLAPTLTECLPWLAKTLGTDTANWTLDTKGL